MNFTCAVQLNWQKKDVDGQIQLPKLGIGKEHYEAIEKAVKDLGRQGLAIEIIKE